VRGIMLKGSGIGEITPNIWPLALILVVVSVLALKRYQRTLD
jgi:ABC-2 type transport system permease protein